jgi:hypothetical protein
VENLKKNLERECAHGEYARVTRDRAIIELQAALLQKYEAAADYLEAEAKKIPLGEGNQQRGFSSTYNALAFAVEVLRSACALKPVDERACCTCGGAGLRDIGHAPCKPMEKRFCVKCGQLPEVDGGLCDGCYLAEFGKER